MCGLTCKRVQCDEIWAFCYAKDKNVPADQQGRFGFGSVWARTTIDADTKLIPSVGGRSRKGKPFRKAGGGAAIRLEASQQECLAGQGSGAGTSLRRHVPAPNQSRRRSSGRRSFRARRRRELSYGAKALIRPLPFGLPQPVIRS